MKSPKRVLDLFCKAGGSAMGLMQAWPNAIITGVDIAWQKNYCGHEFIQGDALEVAKQIGRKFDFIWASPPCQHYSIASKRYRNEGYVYPDLVAATRDCLRLLNIPWVMENVPNAPLRKDLVLCGSNFGLKVVRHRIFEFFDQRTWKMPLCAHPPDLITVCGHGSPSWVMQQRIKRGFHPNPTIQEKRDAMEINWMNRGELSEAVPPAYSRYIAEQYLLWDGRRESITGAIHSPDPPRVVDGK